MHSVLFRYTGSYKGRAPSEDVPEASWVQLQQVYDWVVETKEYKPVVVDAGNLLENPGALRNQTTGLHVLVSEGGVKI